MRLRVAVDFGTSSTCVAVSVDGREPQVVAIDGSPLMSSAVYAGPKGTLFVGQEAERHAAIDPSRYEPHPKRRIDERELLLGNTVLPVSDVIRAVLARAVAEARRVAGGAPVDQLVLTHPADWGGVRTQVLRGAARGLATRIVLIPEPAAAAVFHAASFPGGRATADRALAVLDLGGGTVDVSVVRRAPARGPGAPAYQVLATRGTPNFGGADIDQLLLDHVGSMVSATSSADSETWRSLIEGRELPDRRRRRVIHQDVRGAKETLSRHTYTDIPLPPPFPDAHVTRTDLERLISAPLRRAAELTETTIRAAGLTPPQLAGIFLVGGSSRIPMMARLIHERCGVMPITLDQPETVVARGALRAVSAEPDGTGRLPTRTVADADPTRPMTDRGPARPLGDATRPVSPLTPPHGRPVTAPVPVPPAPAPPNRRRRLLWLGGAAAVVVAGAVALVLALTAGGDQNPSSVDQPEGTRPIAQWEYRFALPNGWIQTGGDPTKLRTEIKPEGKERGQDRILVEETRLAFNSDASRARAVDKLREDFERATGGTFSGFEDNASYAGRQLIRYQEHLDQSTVDWYVIFKSDAQVSIGCQYTETGRDQVHSACETVVRTMTITA